MMLVSDNVQPRLIDLLTAQYQNDNSNSSGSYNAVMLPEGYNEDYILLEYNHLQGVLNGFDSTNLHLVSLIRDGVDVIKTFEENRGGATPATADLVKQLLPLHFDESIKIICKRHYADSLAYASYSVWRTE
ncbi:MULTISPECIES: hypothetical protein [unclassified Pseudoalteromonas]|uniref:hypothetical protein n=1 Tax=unclassified Pseudoalteromonas TaxID=194690 RepID=UPI001F2F725A|nr:MULTISPECIES: hypothetical protein [unclassified Pseudoalteromonas]MCF2826928.1 hypothetical protein [Pseudoalteromonas sp. OF5H-5]MCF2830625.1 hypothetical protein [Pseudoalteromonas sp. DL2-H6]MCF2923943.1 hypothetical protein [Pseudoalteromonas sp. DL2-H1]